ncbi:MAG: hypothetical protein F6J87_28945 [Spirulina sp. SIO3F2]|nr:hypothetical protein [Spirulina sp. SIO3F2]
MSQLLLNLRHTTLLEQIVNFGLLLGFVLAIAKRLLYRLIYAFAPESKSQRFMLKPRPVRVAIAIADMLAWTLAVMVACLVLGLPQVSQLLVSLVGIVWSLLPLTITVVLVAYCFSRTGNELLLSALGAWYLKHRKKVLERHRYFDLGEGQEGEIDSINFLDTTFRLKKGGRIVIRPNAFLMHEVFGFASAIGLEGLIDRFQNWQAHQVKRNPQSRDSERES